MAVTRMDWTDLPVGVRDAVENRTGPIRHASTAPAGMNSAIAAVLDTASGRVFVKGLPTDYPRRRTQDYEAAVAPAVSHLSPALLWRVQTDGWDLLGFQVVTGRHADYQPGSPDLALVTDTMTDLGKASCPPGVRLRDATERWKPYISSADDLRWLAGDTLLHTDWNPANVIVSGDRAVLIDWAWPTRGAAFIDPVCLIIRLITAGHTPIEAEHVVADVPAWRTAPTRALNVFADATARVWDEIAQQSTDDWKHRMAHAAHQWRDHRRRTR